MQFSPTTMVTWVVPTLSHEIPLLDDAPVRQRYRRIPPSEYEEVKAHIDHLLEAKVIRESIAPSLPPLSLCVKRMVVSVCVLTTAYLIANTEGRIPSTSH